MKRFIKWLKSLHFCYYEHVEDYPGNLEKHKCKCGNFAYKDEWGRWYWFGKEEDSKDATLNRRKDECPQ